MRIGNEVCLASFPVSHDLLIFFGCNLNLTLTHFLLNLIPKGTFWPYMVKLKAFLVHKLRRGLLINDTKMMLSVISAKPIK